MQAMAGLLIVAIMIGAGMDTNMMNGVAQNAKKRRPTHEKTIEKRDGAEKSGERRRGWRGSREAVNLDSVYLQLPVAGLTTRHLNDTWGAARSEGRTHEGIDIFASRNTPVLSASDGVIIRQGESDRGGTVVWIYGTDGLSHYYAHLENFSDHKVGQNVAAGDTIGYVGNSGNAITTPPHLHYGVYTDTGATNPYPLLTRR